MKRGKIRNIVGSRAIMTEQERATNKRYSEKLRKKMELRRILLKNKSLQLLSFIPHQLLQSLVYFFP